MINLIVGIVIGAAFSSFWLSMWKKAMHTTKQLKLNKLRRLVFFNKTYLLRYRSPNYKLCNYSTIFRMPINKQ